MSQTSPYVSLLPRMPPPRRRRFLPWPLLLLLAAVACYADSRVYRAVRGAVAPRAATSQIGSLDPHTDLPLLLMFSPMLPLDARIEYRLLRYNTPDGPVYNSSHHLTGRYALFSPILSDVLWGEVEVFGGSGCLVSPADYEAHRERCRGKVVVLLRGECLFFVKAQNVVEFLEPRAVVIADTDPENHALITMYARAGFSDIGADILDVPALFVTNESFEVLRKYAKERALRMQPAGSAPVVPDLDSATVRITTIDDSLLLRIVLSIVFSPPLVLLAAFVVIRQVQLYSVRSLRVDETFVKRHLPVWIYHYKFLIREEDFVSFIKFMEQHRREFTPLFLHELALCLIPGLSRSSVSLVEVPPVGSSMQQQLARLAETLPPLIRVLYPGTDARHNYYNTSKCSICLDNYSNLELEVIWLEFCHHIFHKECISHWFLHHNKKCPLCKDDITRHTYMDGAMDPTEARVVEEIHAGESTERTPLLAVQSHTSGATSTMPIPPTSRHDLLPHPPLLMLLPSFFSCSEGSATGPVLQSIDSAVTEYYTPRGGSRTRGTLVSAPTPLPSPDDTITL